MPANKTKKHSLFTDDGMLITSGRYMGFPCLFVCDHKCEKAWGANGRRSPETMIEFDEDDPDDMAYLPDHEVGEAPRDPGTYEGSDGKPWKPAEHNKWCVRECERCSTIDFTKTITPQLSDFSKRVYNMQDRQLQEEGPFF